MEQRRVGPATVGGSFQLESGGTLPFVLPGELVGLQPGGVVEVLERSPDRVEPVCVHFGVCGGCQLQHAVYAAQLRIKAELLGGILAQAGALPEAQVHAGEPWGYRNRVRFRVERVDGALRVGYSRRASNDFLPVRLCSIAAPVLWRAAEALLRVAAEPGPSMR